MTHTYNIESKFGLVGGLLLALHSKLSTLAATILDGHWMSAINQSWEVLWLGAVGATGTVVGTHIAKLGLRWVSAKLKKQPKK